MLQTVRRPLSGKASSRPAGVRLGVRGACAALAVFALSALPAEGQKITEVVADHVGSPDTYEFIEVAANPASVLPPGVSDTLLVDLSSYTILELDGSTVEPREGPSRLHPGNDERLRPLVDRLHDVDTRRPGLHASPRLGLHGRGRATTSTRGTTASSTRPPGARSPTASPSPTALREPGPTQRPSSAPGFDGTATPPGELRAFRTTVTSDLNGDWKRNDFDGAGLPGMAGTLAAGEARNTAGIRDAGGACRTSTRGSTPRASPRSGRRSTRRSRRTSVSLTRRTRRTSGTSSIPRTRTPSISGEILDIYKNAVYTKISGGTGAYNREHSWPNSYGFNNDQAAFRIHGLPPPLRVGHRLTTRTGETSRTGPARLQRRPPRTRTRPSPNHGFGGGTGTYPGNSNWDNGAVYEVWNHRRGDIARAQFYMDVRYEGGTHPYTGSTEADLILTDNTSLIQTNAALHGLPLRPPPVAPRRPRRRRRARPQRRHRELPGEPEPVRRPPRVGGVRLPGNCGGNPSIVFAGIQTATDPNLCAVTGVNLSVECAGSLERQLRLRLQPRVPDPPGRRGDLHGRLRRPSLRHRDLVHRRHRHGRRDLRVRRRGVQPRERDGHRQQVYLRRRPDRRRPLAGRHGRAVGFAACRRRSR